jgi:hypothetical protein
MRANENKGVGGSMASPKRKPQAQPTVEAKLVDGHYDRVLAEFQEKLDEAAAALRRCHAAMRAENTLRS